MSQTGSSGSKRRAATTCSRRIQGFWHGQVGGGQSYPARLSRLQGRHRVDSSFDRPRLPARLYRGGAARGDRRETRLRPARPHDGGGAVGRSLRIRRDCTARQPTLGLIIRGRPPRSKVTVSQGGFASRYPSTVGSGATLNSPHPRLTRQRTHPSVLFGYSFEIKICDRTVQPRGPDAERAA
jgi:hypothetical protein